MTRKTNRKSAPRVELTGRDLWLASIGAVSLGRKQLIAGYGDAFDNVQKLQQRAVTEANKAGKQLRSLKTQAEARVAPILKQADKAVSQARFAIETRLAPVLGRFGVKQAKPAARKPAARKAAKRSRKSA